MDDIVADVLGESWVARTLTLRPDAVARRTGVVPVATMVSLREVDPTRTAVLYIHGFVDYFFQAEFGEDLARAGYQLYALDLRDCGRSIRDGRPAMSTNDLAAYVEEIDLAVRELKRSHPKVVLLGHSAGGLVSALWADARPGVLDGLVLNSPWLDLRGSWFERTVLTAVLDVVGRVAPATVVAHLGPHYGRALHRETGGEWDYDLTWKPHEDAPVRAGFVRTVRRAHARVGRGLWIDCPVLVLASDSSGPDDRWHERLLTSDCVLDVDDIRRRSQRLGVDVTYATVPGGAHDLALSPSPARAGYLAEVVEFLDSRVG
ncbi:MAG: alpha/beta hydrolase [Actinobacteria bacterium]|nr:alpha/beta hydrolase [Actinomycetota bacterium]MCG2803228.1 alpha/beta hydrolase [Cellulomonas sp.]